MDGKNRQFWQKSNYPVTLIELHNEFHSNP